MGAHANHVGQLERGEVHSPRLSTVVACARALDVSAGVLAASYFTALSGPLPRLEPPDRDHQGGPSALGRGLRALRRERGMSQIRLAHESEMHRNYVGVLEAGAIDSPGLRTIAKVVRGLDPHPASVAANVDLLVRVYAGEVDDATVSCGGVA